MSSNSVVKRPRVELATIPIRPYEHYSQPKVYPDLSTGVAGGDRQYMLNLSGKKAAESGVNHKTTMTWDLASAPKPRDGKTHQAAYHIESVYVNEGGSGDLFAQDTRYLVCLDVPQPNDFSASLGHTAVVGNPTTAQVPNTFYTYYSTATSGTAAARRMLLTNTVSNTYPVVSVYPVPTITLEVRESLYPAAIHQTGATNVDLHMSIQLSITLLD